MEPFRKRKHTMLERTMIIIIMFGGANLALALISGGVIILSGLSHLQPGENTASVIAISYYSFLFSSAWVTIPILISIFSFGLWAVSKTESGSSSNSPSNIRTDRATNFYIDKFLNFLSLTEKKIIHWYNN